MTPAHPSLAFVGGTGPEGLGLAMRFAAAGHEIIIGSRRQERADEAAQKILEKVPKAKVRGSENADAVRSGEHVVVTVPYGGQRDTLEGLRDVIGDKIVICTVVPVEVADGKISGVPVNEGSAAEEAQAVLPEARVAGAFQNLSARKLMDLANEVPADVVVTADDEEAKRAAMAMAESIAGVRGLDGGGLANSRYVEEITVLLMNINKIHKARSSVRIVGV